jgi:adenosylcobinamide-GDP ribazoletransferase
LNDFAAALSLLTIAPIRRQLDYSARALPYFPIVGALLGLILFFAYSVLGLVLPPLVTAALVTLLWALLTGGLHLDGVSDACDALFAAAPRERRLEILRDVHTGTFGAVGLVLVLLLKFAALNYVSGSALFIAPVMARWAMVYAVSFPLARGQGMAVLFAKGFTRRQLWLASLALLVFALIAGLVSVGAMFATVVIAVVVARFALGRLGGMTGDIYGLICELVEVGVLVVATVR